MPTYLLSFHGGKMQETPEEGVAVLGEWNRWYDDLGDALVDTGNPVGRSATLAKDATTQDGGPNPVTGYAIIEADDLDAALELAGTCPQLENGTIEVGELFAMTPDAMGDGASETDAERETVEVG